MTQEHLEISRLTYAHDVLYAKLAAREKRMREVAAEIGVASERFCWGEDAILLRTWRAKLLEGIDESASKKEGAPE